MKNLLGNEVLANYRLNIHQTFNNRLMITEVSINMMLKTPIKMMSLIVL